MNRKISWSMAAVLGVFSPTVWALGLGGASVESFLGESLDVRVEVISDSSGELQSITAGLASADDFELLGLSRSAITVPLDFELVLNEVRPYIHITSDLNVNEPVVQVLVEVVWANGRMLREYTLFLDPPTFDSKAPPVLVKPVTQAVTETRAPVEIKSAPVLIDRDAPEPEVQEAAKEEPVVQEPEEDLEQEQLAEEPVAEKPIAEQERVAEDEQAAEEKQVAEPEQGADQETTTEQEPGSEQEAIKDQEPGSEQEAIKDQEPTSDQETTSEEELPTDTVESTEDDEIYGPVANGETLWGIASKYSKGSGYSVHQAMMAFQRKNPEAFIRGNINSLKRGAILRLPAASEMAELTSREALLESMRQQEALMLSSRPSATELSTPTVADSGDYQETVSEPISGPVTEEDPGHLELVPPVDENRDESVEEQLPDPGVSDDSIKEELARTEEELVNAQQENTYLNQRIQELEAKVQAQAENAISVEDSGLASLESNLAKERAADKPEPPVAITPGGEAQAWYAGKTGFIVGIAVILIGLIVWALRRRSTGFDETEQAEAETVASDSETIVPVPEEDVDENDTVVPLKSEIKSEPEQLTGTEPETEPEPAPEPEPAAEPEPAPEPETSGEFVPDEEHEDHHQDLQLDDPETKLDLARAYLSLGDKEASRSMLDEVLKSGSEEQRAEARQMLDEIK